MSCVDVIATSTDLWQHVTKEDSNVIISPLSIQIAFSMVLLGARALTSTEMKKALHIDKCTSNDQWLDVFFKIFSSLNASQSNSVNIHMANRIFVQNGFALEPEFTSNLLKYFKAKAGQVNLSASTESAKIINDWVEKQTNSKIKNLISPSSLSADTRLVLVNALYFQGEWLHKFKTRDSIEHEFHLLTKQTKKVTMMKRQRVMQSLDDSQGELMSQIVQLPFIDQRFSLVVVLPTENKYQSVKQSLNGKTIEKIMGSLIAQEVELRLPKFKVESSFVLNEVMKSLGMNSLFDANSADLSGISRTNQLVVSEAVHKAFLSVNEAGVEAAAATGVVAILRSLTIRPEPAMRMTVDRPFLVWIWDDQNKVPLFMAQISNP